MKPKILIVEDDESIPMLLTHWVRKHFVDRLEVEVVRDLASAIQAAPSSVVILLDLTLPPDGPKTTLETISALRIHAPVIVLTGYEDSNPPYASQILCDAVAHGADSCVFKSMILQPQPNNADIWLMWVIQSALHRWSYNKQVAKQAVPV